MFSLTVVKSYDKASAIKLDFITCHFKTDIILSTMVSIEDAPGPVSMQHMIYTNSVDFGVKKLQAP